MDLHSGLPFWLVKNGLLADFPALDQDLLNEEIVIIGSGISGALTAHELCGAGFRCSILDKRLLSAGSTWASTAHLNYELDLSMQELTEKYNEAFAVGVYEASFASVSRIQSIAKETVLDECLQTKSSLYLASNKKGEKAVVEEYEMRRRHNFPVELLDREAIHDFRIEKRYNQALYHEHAAQVDAYRMTVGLIEHNVRRGNLTVYTRTCVENIESTKNGITLKTNKGHTVNARYVVCAPGYESAQFLPKKVMHLASTYALVTQPLSEADLWKEGCLIWESLRPYFYLRTTSDNRIMMGGEDEAFSNEHHRDRLMEKKKIALLKSCTELFPHLQIEADFLWCGTFGNLMTDFRLLANTPEWTMCFLHWAMGATASPIARLRQK